MQQQQNFVCPPFDCQITERKQDNQKGVIIKISESQINKNIIEKQADLINKLKNNNLALVKLLNQKEKEINKQTDDHYTSNTNGEKQDPDSQQLMEGLLKETQRLQKQISTYRDTEMANVNTEKKKQPGSSRVGKHKKKHKQIRELHEFQVEEQRIQFSEVQIQTGGITEFENLSEMKSFSKIDERLATVLKQKQILERQVKDLIESNSKLQILLRNNDVPKQIEEKVSYGQEIVKYTEGNTVTKSLQQENSLSSQRKKRLKQKAKKFQQVYFEEECKIFSEVQIQTDNLLANDGQEIVKYTDSNKVAKSLQQQKSLSSQHKKKLKQKAKKFQQVCFEEECKIFSEVQIQTDNLIANDGQETSFDNSKNIKYITNQSCSLDPAIIKNSQTPALADPSLESSLTEKQKKDELALLIENLQKENNGLRKDIESLNELLEKFKLEQKIRLGVFTFEDDRIFKEDIKNIYELINVDILQQHSLQKFHQTLEKLYSTLKSYLTDQSTPRFFKLSSKNSNKLQPDTEREDEKRKIMSQRVGMKQSISQQLEENIALEKLEPIFIVNQDLSRPIETEKELPRVFQFFEEPYFFKKQQQYHRQRFLKNPNFGDERQQDQQVVNKKQTLTIEMKPYFIESDNYEVQNFADDTVLTEFEKLSSESIRKILQGVNERVNQWIVYTKDKGKIDRGFIKNIRELIGNKNLVDQILRNQHLE